MFYSSKVSIDSKLIHGLIYFYQSVFWPELGWHYTSEKTHKLNSFQVE